MFRTCPRRAAAPPAQAGGVHDGSQRLDPAVSPPVLDKGSSLAPGFDTVDSFGFRRLVARPIIFVVTRSSPRHICTHSSLSEMIARRSSVLRSVSQPSPAPTTLRTSAFLLSIKASIFSSSVPAQMSMHLHIAHLTDAIRTIRSLILHRRVPPAVKVENVVSSREIQPGAPAFSERIKIGGPCCAWKRATIRRGASTPFHREDIAPRPRTASEGRSEAGVPSHEIA